MLRIIAIVTALLAPTAALAERIVLECESEVFEGCRDGSGREVPCRRVELKRAEVDLAGRTITFDRIDISNPGRATVAAKISDTRVTWAEGSWRHYIDRHTLRWYMDHGSGWLPNPFPCRIIPRRF
jgi:hypothetical protein